LDESLKKLHESPELIRMIAEKCFGGLKVLDDNPNVVHAVIQWQSNPKMHPLTCGVKSSHKPLYPYPTEDGWIVLKCGELDCDYIQKHIPDVVLKGVEYEQTENGVRDKDASQSSNCTGDCQCGKKGEGCHKTSSDNHLRQDGEPDE